jgi:hypothetical protein
MSERADSDFLRDIREAVRRLTTHWSGPAPSALGCIGGFAFVGSLVAEQVLHGPVRAAQFVPLGSCR